MTSILQCSETKVCLYDTTYTMRVVIVLLGLAVCLANGASNRENFINNLPTELHKFGIKGGQKIKIEQAPYTVAVELQPPSSFNGAGVLIANNWVLTAARNVYSQSADNVKIRVGTDNATSKGTLMDVEKIVAHPKYDEFWGYNLALVKLTKNVQVSKKVKPILLGHSLPKAGEKTVVSGYGATVYELQTDNQLRQATVPFIPFKTCQKKYTPSIFTNINFCASKPGVGPCPLDWGDPLVYKNKLIGIFSGSFGDCGSAEYPGVYADITQFIGWIKSIIKH